MVGQLWEFNSLQLHKSSILTGAFCEIPVCPVGVLFPVVLLLPTTLQPPNVSSHQDEQRLCGRRELLVALHNLVHQGVYNL